MTTEMCVLLLGYYYYYYIVNHGGHAKISGCFKVAIEDDVRLMSTVLNACTRNLHLLTVLTFHARTIKYIEQLSMTQLHSNPPGSE